LLSKVSRFGYRVSLWGDHDDKTETNMSKPREALYRDRYLSLRTPLIILVSLQQKADASTDTRITLSMASSSRTTQSFELVSDKSLCFSRGGGVSEI